MANSNMIVRVMADTKNYNANLAQASRTLSNFAKNNLTASGAVKQMTTAMTGMAAQFIGAYAAINAAKKVIGDMININKQFEQGTANLASIMGQSREEIVKLTNQAKQLGATTRYTAMQITELQTNLARLGFTQQEILNSTTAVQALATATGADLGEAANLAGAALRGFGLNATEMERVASVLSVSTTKSALSFEKLATAVPIVAPVAKQFGFTIEDTVTLLAKLSDAGMDASTAATATRNIFLKMANDSGKLATALGRQVHSVEEFGEALAEMRKKGMSLNDILQMVGVRSTAAFAVFADNAETLKDFKQSITDCGDAMHDMESKQLDTLQGSLIILNSAWEGLMLTFSESNGTIKAVTDSLTGLLQAWTRWRNRNQGGDAAIQTYELADSQVAKYGKQYIEADRAAGMSDEAIKRNAENEVQAITSQRDAMHDLLKEWEKAGSLGWGSKEIEALIPQVTALFGNLNGAAYQWSEQMQKAIAGKNDSLAVNNYIVSALGNSASSGGSDANAAQQKDESIKLLRAKYEAEAKEQIAALDRMTMEEEDYEAKVYEIKRTALERILKLYDEDSKEYAQVMARKYDLDIRYQATQMRLANRSKKASDEGGEEYIQGVERTPLEELQTKIRAQQAEKADALDQNTLNTLIGVTLQNGINSLDLDFSQVMAQMWEGMDIKPEQWHELETKINEELETLNLDPIKLDVETGNLVKAEKQVKGTTEAWQAAASAVATVGSALQQIEDPAAKIAGIIATAVAQVALTFATSLKGTVGPWDWIAAATTGLATMISTITAIKSVTSAGSYAEGGIIPGNNYNDGLVANVSSGELILNRAQQDSIASQLTSNPFDNLQLSMAVDGTKFLVLLNNVNRSRGGSRSFYTERH